MKQILFITLAIAVLVNACGAEKGIEIHEAWIRPASQGENGAIYFVIHNHSSTADEMTGVSSSVARAAEMHESKMSGDVMQMHHLESVPLEPYAELKFGPGGFHLMLVALKKDLKAGDEIDVTIHFKNFEDIELTVPVRDAPADEEDH